MQSSWIIFLGFIGLPLASFLVLSIGALLELRLKERILSSYCRWLMFVHFLTTLATGFYFLRSSSEVLSLDLGHWYLVGHYKFELGLLIDHISFPLILTGSFILNVVVYFCVKYLHRDLGHFRFCMLYLLFCSGISLVLLAGTVDLLFAGWELLGLSSALLIGYYHERQRPARNGLIAFSYYRFCDVALLTAAVLWHHFAGSSQIPVEFLDFQSINTTQGIWITSVMALMFVIASLAKSAQFPMQSWLPRAMEGPTPSSAIFYGALSIHAGAYLLLRMSPVLQQIFGIRVLIGSIGLITWIFGSFVGRTRSDIKTALAYACMSQVGLIYVEIALGWVEFATFHMVAHSLLRTLQFLRTPNVLHDFNTMGKQFIWAPHSHLEKLIPKTLRLWVYRQALLGGNVDVFFRYIVEKLFKLVSATMTRNDKKQFEAKASRGDKL